MRKSLNAELLIGRSKSFRMDVLLDSVAETALALQHINWRHAARLKPHTLREAGRIVQRLRSSGVHKEAELRAVLGAAFCLPFLSLRLARRQVELAFDVWDRDQRGLLSLSLLREIASDLSDAPASVLDEAVGCLDYDGSGAAGVEAFEELLLCLTSEASEAAIGLAKSRGAAATEAARVAGPDRARLMSRCLHMPGHACQCLPIPAHPCPSLSIHVHRCSCQFHFHPRRAERQRPLALPPTSDETRPCGPSRLRLLRPHGSG